MSLQRRWLIVIGTLLLQPLLMHLLFPLVGHTVNAISFIPPVIATILLGLRFGFAAVAIGYVSTSVVFHLNAPMPPADWIPRSILSLALTSVICLGTYWARKTFFLQRKTKAALQDTEEQYRQIFENSGQGIVCINPRGVITDANQQALDMLGISSKQFYHLNWTDITVLSSQGRDAVRGRLSGTEDSGQGDIFAEIKQENLDDPIYLEISMSCIAQSNQTPRWVLMLKDISEKRRIEAQLQHAQKMESIGRLAGGVAHDINNVLNAIMGASFALHKEIRTGGDTSGDLETITSACDQGAQLTRTLLGFARKSQFSDEVFPINHVVESVLGLIRRTAPKKIRIDASLQEGSILMKGDPSIIENAVMNLCLNAIDAMGDRGTLKIKTRTKNGHFFLSVGDTGAGIDESIKERVFEPFFTTKPVGKGTGLGLAMVYGAVQQHKGRIGIESNPGKGTTMILTFPRYDGEIQRRDSLMASPINDFELPLASYKILLVDDEPIVLRAAQRMMSALGAEVKTAKGSTEAVTLFNAVQKDVDLVILDLVMPEMDGTALLKEMRSINPDVPALIASGFSPDPEKLNQLRTKIPRFEFLKKPYKTQDLLRAIETLGILPASISSPEQRLSSGRK